MSYLKSALVYLIYCYILLSNIPAYGICNVIGYSVYPDKPTLQKNSRILIVGHLVSARVIENLNSSYPVYLLHEKHKVKLKVIEQFKCNGQTQALLQPQSKLTPGEEYFLCIENIPENETPGYTYASKKAVIFYKYRITDEVDSLQPVISGNPEFVRSKYVVTGCGPESYVKYSMQRVIQDNYWIKATIKDTATKEVQTAYVVPEKDNTFNIGYSICGGEFRLTNNTTYELTLSVIDYCGNTTTWGGTPLKFISAAAKNWWD